MVYYACASIVPPQAVLLCKVRKSHLVDKFVDHALLFTLASFSAFIPSDPNPDPFRDVRRRASLQRNCSAAREGSAECCDRTGLRCALIFNNIRDALI